MLDYKKNYKIEVNDGYVLFHTMFRDPVDLRKTIDKIDGVSHAHSRCNYETVVYIGKMFDREKIVQLVGKEIDLYCYKKTG